ncbi:MAG: hypothetical protein LBQ94_00820 [Treponema sp.]|nr:hypothetical protein [Treponema sp.]
MKKLSVSLAMLALALALGLAFVSCDDGSGTTGSGNTPGGGGNTVSPFEGIWVESSTGMQLIFTGNTFLLKQQDGVNLKRCSFTYTQTTLTETILDNYGGNYFGSIGDVTTVNYTLVGNVLTITTVNQVWNKVN